MQLANEIGKENIAADLVLACASGPYLEEVSGRVRVIDLGCGSVSRALPDLVGYLKRERPRSLLSGLDHANVVAIAACKIARCGTDSVISIRSVPSAAYRYASTRRGRILFRIARVMYRFADRIVANSDGVAEDFARFYGLSRDRVDVIHNPVSLRDIQASSRKENGHPWLRDNGPPIVLGAGRFVAVKDFPTLIRAFSEVHQRISCRLVILGEGPQRDTLERLVETLDLGDRVLMPGFDRNPYAWMRRARVFVSSSVSEGCPNSLMQALACGTRVVSTTSLGGAAEILEGGKWGRLVPVGDVAALAHAITDSLGDGDTPDLTRRALDFSPEKIAARYLDVLLRG